MKNPYPSVSPSIALISSVMGPNDTGWAMVNFFSASWMWDCDWMDPLSLTFPFSVDKYFILFFFFFFKSVPLSSPRPESRTKPWFCGFLQQPPKWVPCVYSCSPLICLWQFSFDSGRALWLRTDFWRKKVLSGLTNWLHNGDYSWPLSLGQHYVFLCLIMDNWHIP